MALADYQTIVTTLVQDVRGSIKDEERDQAIDMARIRYSTDRPRQVLAEVTTDGSAFLPAPVGWEEKFSQAVALEYAGGDLAFEQVETLAGSRIKPKFVIPAGRSVIVTFTILHSLSAAQDTIPVQDREAVGCYATSLLMEQLASLYAGHRQSNLQADSIDYQSKGREYSSRAKAFMKRYLDHMGIDTKRTVPAGTVVNLDRPDSRGRDRIIHRQGRR